MSDIVKKKRVAWNKGKPRSEESKLKQKQTCLEKYGVSNVFQIKEIKERLIDVRNTNAWVEKVRETKQEKYGDPKYTNVEKIKQTKLERYGDENYNNALKASQTSLERYGVPHHNQDPKIKEKIRKKKLTKETQEKYEQTLLNRYGTTNINLVPEIKNKREQIFLNKYGVKNPLQNKSIKTKQLETLRRNNTFNKSKLEEDYYKYLLTLYPEEDILRQYRDERYPFDCDFYIKSEDRFIECNFHWTHGKHLFSPMAQEDLDKLATWQEKAKTSQFYKNAICTWTVRDVEKYNIAKHNNLNIEFLYNK